jgi:hypothetical protein
MKQFLGKQADLQTKCLELLKTHYASYTEIEWEIQDGQGPSVTIWKEKAQLKLVKMLSFSGKGQTEFPPPNTRLCDELVYLATKSLYYFQRALWYPYDFNSRGDINPDRVPSGAAPIIWAHGIPFFPVYKGYYILCGRDHSICIGWLINELERDTTKVHPVWSVGAVVAPESAVRAPHTIDRQMHLHKPYGQALDVRYRGRALARDVVSADHHHCAVLPSLSRQIQVCPLWMYPGYNVRCGPVDPHVETTVVKEAFFIGKGLGNKYSSLAGPYLNSTSGQSKASIQSGRSVQPETPIKRVLKDTLDSSTDTHESVETEELIPKDVNNYMVPSLPAETSVAEKSLGLELVATTGDVNPTEQIVIQQSQTTATALDPFSQDTIIEQSEPQTVCEPVTQLKSPHLEPSSGSASSPGLESSAQLEPSFGFDLFSGVWPSAADYKDMI